MPSASQPPHRLEGPTDEAGPAPRRQSAWTPSGPIRCAGASGFLEVEAAMTLRGRAHRVRVWHILYVLAALTAFSAVELRGGAGTADVHDMFSWSLSSRASISGKMQLWFAPTGPGNGDRRTYLGSAGNPPMPPASQPPHRLEGPTDEAVSNLSAWPRQVCSLRG